MVAAEEVPLQASAKRGAPSTGRWQLAAVLGLVGLTLLVAPVLISRGSSQSVVLEDDTDELSGNLLGALEKAMDKSIDNKVEAFMSAPGVASIPVPKFPESESDEHEAKDDTSHFVPSTYLEHLQAEKKELEQKREKLLNDLRAEHSAVAAEAAKQSTEANKVRLESALYRAKKRQLEHAQDAARQAAKKMREALIAKQQAIHAEAVAKVRAHILDSMEHEAAGDDTPTEEAYFKAPHPAASHIALSSIPAKSAASASAKPASAVKSASTARSTEEGGSKLAVYEAQEKELLRKIAAAKKKAKLAAAEAKGSAGGHVERESMEGKVIQTLAKTVKKNQVRISSDEAKAAALKKQEVRLLASVQALKGKDTALQVKEKMLNH